jgi:CelD/BcsL family acetyltransferase involved in cellulose biosynthesis
MRSVGSTPIAYHFGFELDGVLTWYKPSFDPELQQRSPGEVLIKLLLDDALARDLDEFDFTVGSEAFKFRFANLIRQVLSAACTTPRLGAIGRPARGTG